MKTFLLSLVFTIFSAIWLLSVIVFVVFLGLIVWTGEGLPELAPVLAVSGGIIAIYVLANLLSKTLRAHTKGLVHYGDLVLLPLWWW